MTGISLSSSSTTATGKGVWADAVGPVSAALATEIEVEKDWQTGYVPRVVAVVGAGTRSHLDTFRTEQSLAEIWSVSARDSREAPGVQSRAGSRPT